MYYCHNLEHEDMGMMRQFSAGWGGCLAERSGHLLASSQVPNSRIPLKKSACPVDPNFSEPWARLSKRILLSETQACIGDPDNVDHSNGAVWPGSAR